MHLRKDILESFRKPTVLSMLLSCSQGFVFICWIKRYMKANNRINKIDLMIVVEL